MGDAAPNIEKAKMAGNMKLNCIFDGLETLGMV